MALLLLPYSDQNGATGKAAAQRGNPGTDEQGGERVAADSGDSGGPTKCAGPYHPLLQHSEEEMGREFGLHGPLRICRRVVLLGWVGLFQVFRGACASIPGTSKRGVGPEVPFPPNFLGKLAQRHTVSSFSLPLR